MLYQAGALSAFVKAQGITLQHIKLHGSFYNDTANNKDRADAVLDGIAGYDTNLIVLILSGSYMAQEAKRRDLRVAEEVFADYGYNADGGTRKLRRPSQLLWEECTYSDIKYLPCGETAITIEFGNEISKEITAKIRKTILALEKEQLEGIVEIVSTYRSILLQYAPLRWTFSEMTARLRHLSTEASGKAMRSVSAV